MLVLTPNNHALYSKWIREVGEFKRRCVFPEQQSNDPHFFAFSKWNGWRTWQIALRKPGRQPQILVARMGLFGGDKLLNYDLKRRFLLGVLFRYWGVIVLTMNTANDCSKVRPQVWPKKPRRSYLTD